MPHPSEINPVQLNVRLFNITWSTASITADASTLGFLPGVSPYGPLYMDACDVGFQLINPHTGTTSRWCLHEECKDADGDIVCWKFKAVDLRKGNEHLLKWIVTIFND